MNIKVKMTLLVILAIFVVHSLNLNFTQDDAFISYRYAQNFIQGKGLVFNAGERVEGYTNFLWIILLSLFAGLGLDMIIVSKILGIASGCVTLFLLHQISQLFFSKRDWLFSLFPSFLLTSSSAFAYWSISGLETTFFVMMVLVSVYLYLIYPRLWVTSCALSVLIRPEGGLIFGVLILHKLLFRKDPLRESLSCLGGFVLLLLPFVIFKVFYYGDVLPNPFYAKTGLSFEYVKSGLEYFWLFLRHYALWGVFYLVPVFFYKSLDSRGRLLMLLVYLYTLYVVIIGGDVLKVHRFFLPVLPLLYLLFVICLKRLYVKFKANLNRRMVLAFVVLSIPTLLFFLPHRWIHETKAMENGFVEKMRFVGEYFKQHYGSGFSVAVTTIGSISYHAGTEVKVIDMLGLTDPYIAKHPERIPGILSTWKEKSFNNQYLLSLNPDVIMFSTGVKPSAPAERALFLSSKFRENYYPYYFFEKILFAVYRKKGEYLNENRVFPDVRFVNLYNQAINLEYQADYKASLNKLEEALDVGPKDFTAIYEHMSGCHYLMGNLKEAKKYAQEAVEMDDYCTLAHSVLLDIYLEEGDSAAARQEREKILQYNPEMIQPR